VEVGKAVKFFVQMHDLTGASVEQGGMPFSARLEDSETMYHIKISDHDDGSYSAHYVLQRPGTFKLSVMLNSLHHVYGSPFEVEILPSKTFATKCTAQGTALEMVSLGAETNFLITARDSYGNAKDKGGDPFEVGVMGPAQLTELTDNENGTYTCCIQGLVPEDIDDLATHSLLVMVTLHGKHVSGSPFQPALDVETAKRSTPGVAEQPEDELAPGYMPESTWNRASNMAEGTARSKADSRASVRWGGVEC